MIDKTMALNPAIDNKTALASCNISRITTITNSDKTRSQAQKWKGIYHALTHWVMLTVAHAPVTIGALTHIRNTYAAVLTDLWDTPRSDQNASTDQSSQRAASC